MRQAIFVSYCSPQLDVFKSQVLETGIFLRKAGLDFSYLLFEGLRTWLRSCQQNYEQVNRLRSLYGVRIDIRYLPAPVSPGGMRLAAYFVVKAAVATNCSPLLIKARGAESACVALEAKRKLISAAVIYDARADGSAEARMAARLAHSWPQRHRYLRLARRRECLQRRASAEADHVLAVSGPLRDQLRVLGNRSPESISVIPCCINTHRFGNSLSARDNVRKSLRLVDRLIFVYAGSLDSWQVPDRLASLVSAVRTCLPQVHLLVLTRDHKGAQKYFGKLIKEGACTVQNCAFDAVPDLLAASDIALLLRQDDPVNRVACPVKFAEYQASGLPVIATPGIGDISDYLLRTGFGYLIDLEDSPESQGAQVVQAIREYNWPKSREAIRRQALHTFSRKQYLSVYTNVLSKLEIGVVAPAVAPVQSGSTRLFNKD